MNRKDAKTQRTAKTRDSISSDSLDPQPNVLLRAVTDAGVFALLLFLLTIVPYANGSERFHMALPLAWVADWALWRRAELGATGKLLWRAPLLGALCIWGFVSFFTERFAGPARWPELLWYLLFGSSLLVVGLLLHLAIRVVVGGLERACHKLNCKQVRFWRALRAMVLLVVFLPYLYVAISVHRIKVWETTNPLLRYGYRYQAVTFPACDDDLPLRGWFIPAGNSHATIIVCHGINANMSDFVVAAPFLHDAGYNVFLFDFRGHGDSPGHTTTFGYHEARDVRGAVRYLRDRPDCRRLGVLGYSMGGSAALHAIAQTPEVRAVVVDSTFSNLQDLVASHLQFLPEAPRRFVLATLATATWLEVGIMPDNIAPVRHVAEVAPRPLLIIHGLKDGLVSPDEARALFAAAHQPKQLWLVPLAGHDKAGFVAEREYHRRVLGLFRAIMEPQRRKGAKNDKGK